MAVFISVSHSYPYLTELSLLYRGLYLLNITLTFGKEGIYIGMRKGVFMAVFITNSHSYVYLTTVAAAS